MPTPTRAQLTAAVTTTRTAYESATMALDLRIAQDIAEATARGATGIAKTVDPSTGIRFIVITATSETDMTNALLPDYAAGDAGGYVETTP